MRKILEFGGVAAGVVLIAFGAAAIVLGVNGRSTVQDNLKQQQIVGTPDMTPSGIAAEAKAANLPASIPLPTCSVANKAVTTGAEARCFAQYMQIHAYEATGGVPYSQMPRYASPDGKGTNDAAKATKSASGQPLDNPARDIWVTETALTGALNSAYMAEQISNFGIVVGIALLLTGVGFGILALGGALASGGWLFNRSERKKATAKTTTEPVAG
ncbi:MAG TPA: hypothetical protein VMB53_10035 [Gaiellaceae bacterium]|nr:hypothetical protein [Gaiellaceae bacterium]